MHIEQAIYQRASSVEREIPQLRGRSLSLELTNIIDSVQAVFIKQKFETLEVLTQFETENAYFIFNADPETQEPLNRILTAFEKSNMFVRNMLPENNRSFSMDIKDITTGTNLVNIKRPFKCTFLCWARPMMIVLDYQNNDEIIGTISTPLSCFTDYKFVIKDGDENILFTIIGDCCQCSIWCKDLPCSRCQNTSFSIRNSRGEEVGYMSKKTSGFFKSLVSDCDNYFIRFPDNSPPSHKYLLLVGAIFIDYWLFEGKVSIQKTGK